MVPLSGIGLSSISRVFDVNVPLCTSSGNWCFKGLTIPSPLMNHLLHFTRALHALYTRFTRILHAFYAHFTRILRAFYVHFYVHFTCGLRSAVDKPPRE